MRHRAAPRALLAPLLLALLAGLALGARPAHAAGQPQATLSVPAEVPIGEAFELTATFDNTSAVDPGYGPFVDLILPSGGADGAGLPDDGVSFVGANYLGAPVTATAQAFPAGGCVTHPYARLASGAFQQVCGAPGDTLVTLRLPFGSFTPSQPPVEITVEAELSPAADLGTPLTLRSRAGFQFGNTPLNDWCCDPVILSPGSASENPAPSAGWPGAPVTPTLFTLAKLYVGPESETATGPNFPRRYELRVDVAEGQTLTALDVTDLLPDNLAFVSLISATPAGSALLQTPTVGAAAAPPDNDLVVRFPSVTGGPGPDATVVLEIFAPRTDAAAAAVIDPASGDDATAVNSSSAAGTWDPIDPRDPTIAVSAVGVGVGLSHTLAPKSLAVQKSVAVVVDTGAAGPTPGDTLEYTIDFQVSDYFAFDGVVVEDSFSDGQRFAAGFTPTLQVSGNGFGLAAAAFDAANFGYLLSTGPGPDTDGRTALTLRVSDELVSRGRPSGRLLGGCVDPAGSATPDCGAYNDGPTTGRIVFRTVIQDTFSDTFPSGDPSVDEGDTLDNAVTVTGDLLNTGSFAPSGQPEADTSGASVTIARGAISKSIYAINGSTAFTSPVQVAAGDTVTYRLEAELPSSDVETLRLVDYLPLPIFRADEFGAASFQSLPPGAAAPAAGQARYGPTDSFGAIYGGLPTVVVDPVGNSVEFNYGNYDNVANVQSKVDILLTVTVDSRPTADELFLTNQLRRIQGATNQPSAADDDIIQIEITQPLLRVSKGVVGASSPAATLSPATAGPVPFGAPGAAGAGFTGTINSSNLAAAPIDSNVGGVDANDLVRFAIAIENQGTGLNGAYDVTITDTIPLGLIIPAGAPGLNMRVTDGTGAPIAYTRPDGSAAAPADLFGVGIRLVDGSEGACQAHDLVSGKNIVIITYDLQVSPDIAPGVTVQNRATVPSYAGSEGGPNHVGTPLQDSASVTAATLAPSKLLVASSEAHTSDAASPARVAVGEIVRFRAAVRLPEGNTPALQIRDNLPSGLTFLDDGSARAAFISNSGTITSTTLSGAGLNQTGSAASLAALSSAAISFALPDGAVSSAAASDVDTYASGTDIFFSLGTVRNSDDDPDDEFVVVEFNALADNSATGSNDAGDNRDNSVTGLVAGAASGGNSSNVRVRVAEPSITNVDKVVQSPAGATGDAGDTIAYRVTFANATGTNAADAFEVRLLDNLPAALSLNLASVSVTLGDGASGVTDSSAGNTLDITVGRIPPGGTVQVDYSVTVSAGVSPGQTIDNTAGVTYTSLPGAGGTAGNPTGSTTPGAPGTATGERDGSGAPSQNDHRDSDAATLTILALQPVKSLIATSEAHTSDAASPPRLAVGEIVRYRLAARLAESTSANFQLVDQLPAGLSFLDDGSARVAFVSNGPGISSTTISAGLPGCAGLGVTGSGAGAALPSAGVSCPLPAAAIGGAPFGSGAAVSFSLGDLVNADSDADDEFVVVEFNALADNSAAGGNDAGDTHANSFLVRIGGAQVGTASNTVTTAIAEPSITDVDKVVQSPAGATGDAGDTIAYRVTFANATGADAADAFEVRLLDNLPAALSLNLASVSVTLGGGASGVTDSSAGNTLDITVGRIPPGGTVQVDYSVTVSAGALMGQTITNTAGVTYTSLPGAGGTAGNPTGSTTPGAPGSDDGERDGSGAPAQNDHRDGDTADLALAAPAIEKLTPSPATYTIGEPVDYDLRVTLPEGVTRGLAVSDFLPPGLAYVSHSIVTTAAAAGGGLGADHAGDVGGLSVTRVSPAAAPGGSGEDLVLTFPDIITSADNSAGNNAFLVRVRARVLNLIGNQRGATLDNTAGLSYTDPGSGATVDVADPVAETITVVEPVLSVAKSLLTPPSPADAGGVATYRVVVSHAATSAGTAYDVQVADLLPAELINGAIVNIGAVGVAAPAGAVVAGQVVVPSAGSLDLPPGASVTIDYSAEIAAAVGPGQTVANQATVTWSTRDGADSDERSSGDGPLDGGGLDDYELADGADFTIDAPAFTKSIAATSEPSTAGSDVTIGEVVTYALTVNLPEGSTPSLELTDDLPAGMAFVPGSVVVDTASFNGAAPAPAVASAGGDGDDVTISFGPISVVVDNNGANNNLVVRLQARVLDVPGNVGLTPPGQTTLANSATMTVGASAPVPSNSVDVTVVEPELAITKSFSAATGHRGEVVRVTLTVENQGLAAAHDVVVEDPLPAASFGAVSEAVTPAGFSFSAVAGPGVTTVRYSGGPIPAGASRSFSFDVALGDALVEGAVISNTASVTRATTLTGADPGERDEPDVSGDDTFTIVAPDLELTKVDGGATATPGGTVTFTLLYTNTGSLAASGLVLSETVPDHTSFSAAGSSAGWACAPDAAAGSTCTLSVGALAIGASGSADFVVTVDSALPAGVTEIVNAARIADDGKETDSSDNADSETTPLDAAPDLSIAKSDGESFVRPGQTLTYTLTISNTGDRGATGVVVTDTLPAGVSFVAASDGGAEAAGLVSWPAFALPAGASAERTVTVQVADPFPSSAGVISNSAAVADDGANGADPDPGDNSATDTDLVRPDLAITKTDGGATAAPGATVTYTLHYTNTGGVDVSGVALGETVPLHTSFSPADNPGWSCAAGGGAGSACSYSVGALAAGASGQVDFVVRVVSPLPAGVAQIVNAARVGDDGSRGGDSNPGDNSATEATPAGGAPDLTLTKSDGGTSPLPSRPIAYTLAYGNVGDRGATGVVIRETVPEHTRFDAARSSAGWSCAGAAAGSACSYSVGSLEAGAGGQVRFAVTVTDRLPPGVIAVSNSAAIIDDGASGADPTPANNTDAVTSQFNPTAVLLVSLSASRAGDDIVVRWVTGAEMNSFGFRLLRGASERRADASELTRSLIPSQGGGSGGAAYSFVDEAVEPGADYWYWLVALDLDGTSEEFGPASPSARPAQSTTVYLPLLRR